MAPSQSSDPQGIIPCIFFSFHQFDMFSCDVCKRDIGHAKRIPKVFINCIKISWPISIIDRRFGRIIISAFCISKSANGSYRRNCNISTNPRDILRIPEPICSQLDVHLSQVAYHMETICTTTISSCNSAQTINILTQCLDTSIGEVKKFMQQINALVIDNGIISLIRASHVDENKAHLQGHPFCKSSKSKEESQTWDTSIDHGKLSQII